MNNSEIVSKLWNLCNVLRDDGITYHQYVTELTCVGGERKTVITDKTADEDFFLLTLVAVAIQVFVGLC